jgi:DNA repair protein RecO (recombination protein O)
MLRRTEGIVVKTFPFGEADLIVTLFTLDFGLMRVFAKSPRKTKSRFGSSLEPFSYIKVSFIGKEHAQLPRLTQSDIIYPFQRLREDFEIFVGTTELLEITMGLIPELLPHHDLYAILLDTMRQFENVSERSKWKLFYKAKLLSIAGFSPRLGSCLRCGRKGNFSVFQFHLDEGAVICRGCSGFGTMPHGKNYILLSQGAINLHENIIRWQWNKLDRIVPPNKFIDELDAMINEHIAFRMEREIKTRTFMEKCPTS